MIRLIDFFISFFGIIILLPLFIFVMFIVWLDVKKPFFVQKRVGLNKLPFYLIKFRTMKNNTISAGTHLIDKSKITKTGVFLRNSKIDELPQLWNVLIGDMSLVGPRPCLYNQKELILERDKIGIFSFKPGITGLAQIKKIDMSTPRLLAETDLEMINKLDLKMYFYYIFITLKSIFKNIKFYFFY